MRSFATNHIPEAPSPPRRGAQIIGVAAFVCLFAASCSVYTADEPVALTALTISPTTPTLAVNGTQQFTALGKDLSGAEMAVTPTWSVVAGGGTITSSGLFTAGTTPETYPNTVMATSGGLTSTVTVVVTPGPLAAITVTPNLASIAVGAAQQFSAVGEDASGNVVPITPVWSVVNGGGTADPSTGLFTAGTTAGTFIHTVTATSGGISGTATVTLTAGSLATIAVTPNPGSISSGGTQQFTAIGKDAAGNDVPVTPTWSVVNGGGTIDAATGLFTAGTAGTFNNTVTATSGGVSGTATVVVLPGTLASLVVIPDPATVGIGGTQQFTAIGKDAAGNVVPVTPTWSVVNGGGSIDAGAGLFTAGTVPGTFNNTVSATSGGVSGTATVVVNAGSLASIVVTPDPATVRTGGTQQFTATGKDVAGNVVPITPVWSVVNGGGNINGSGVFTAGTTAGTFNNTVRATSGTVSGTATVIVNPGSLATITVTPDPASVQVSRTQQFTAVGKDASGNVVAITPTWSVVHGGGTINSSGLFTAGTTAAAFPNTVVATSGSISGNADVTVTPGALATITVTPDPATLGTHGTQQFTAVGKDAAGNVVAITPVWSVVNGGGTINSASGLFTAGGTAGTFTNTVRATSGTVSDSATVIVTRGPLASITVTPNPGSVKRSATLQFKAVGADADGNPVAVTPTWSVVNGGGTINASGLFTAGTTTGTFNNSVTATSGAVSGAATVKVTM